VILPTRDQPPPTTLPAPFADDVGVINDLGVDDCLTAVSLLSHGGYGLRDKLARTSVYSARERLGVEIAMTPSRLCALPSTIWSARDGCWGGAFRRRVFWCRHCSTAGPRVTWSKPRPRSGG
jgi:hypothetical protein